MDTKVWYKSKTVWIGILQALSGLIGGTILILQNGLTAESIGALLVGIKGIVDIYLRTISDTTVTLTSQPTEQSNV